MNGSVTESGPSDIWERIRHSRDGALAAEGTERQRLADATELQRTASVRLAARQAVREALGDILDEQCDPERAAAH
jgi:hypothetical protein